MMYFRCAIYPFTQKKTTSRSLTTLQRLVTVLVFEIDVIFPESHPSAFHLEDCGWDIDTYYDTPVSVSSYFCHCQSRLLHAEAVHTASKKSKTIFRHTIHSNLGI